MDEIPFTTDTSAPVAHDFSFSPATNESSSSMPTQGHTSKIKRVAIGSAIIILSVIAMVFANLVVPTYHIPSISPQHMTPTNSGKPVHIVGQLAGKEFSDSLFNITYFGLSLHRNVEMYQYSQNGQEMLWSQEVIKDTEGKNPTEIAIPVEHFDLDPTKLGVFDLSPSIQKQISELNQPKLFPLSQEYFSKLSEDGQKALKLFDNSFYFGLNPASPEVGDIRVQFMTKEAPTVSIVAKQNNSVLEPFIYMGKPIERVTLGAKNILEMTSDLKIKLYPSLAWILRFILVIPLFVGIAIILSRNTDQSRNFPLSLKNLTSKKSFDFKRPKKSASTSDATPSVAKVLASYDHSNFTREMEEMTQNKKLFTNPPSTASDDLIAALATDINQHITSTSPAHPTPSIPVSPFVQSAPSEVDFLEPTPAPTPTTSHKFHSDIPAPEFPFNVEIIGADTETPAAKPAPVSTEPEPLVDEDEGFDIAFSDLPPPPPPLAPTPMPKAALEQMPTAYEPPPPPVPQPRAYAPPPPPPSSYTPTPQPQVAAYVPPPPPPAPSLMSQAPKKVEEVFYGTEESSDEGGGYFPPNDDDAPLFPMEPETSPVTKKPRAPSAKAATEEKKPAARKRAPRTKKVEDEG